MLSQQTLRDGADLRVTQIAGGPVGPQFAYELEYRSADSTEFELVSVWDRPPGEYAIDVYESDGLVVLLTPPRNSLYVRSLRGQWKHWTLSDIVKQQRTELSALLLPPGHEPSTTITAFDADRRRASVDIVIAGWPLQTVELEIAKNGDAIEVVSSSNPSDPRKDYISRLSLAENTELLSVAKDITGDRQSDLLISHAAALNGKAGNIWAIYIATGDGFERFDELLSMRADSLSGWTPGTPDAQSPWFTPGITTYHPKSATSGSIVTYSLQNGVLLSEATSYQYDPLTAPSYETIFRPELTIPVMRSSVPTD